MSLHRYSLPLSLLALLGLALPLQGVPSAASEVAAPGGAPTSITIEPVSSYAAVGTAEVLTAVVKADGAPVAGAHVDFFVADQNAEGGGHQTSACGGSASATPSTSGTTGCVVDSTDPVTDAEGRASFAYHWASAVGQRPLEGSLQQTVTAFTAPVGVAYDPANPSVLSTTASVTWVNSVTSLVLSPSPITVRYDSTASVGATLTYTSMEGAVSAVPYPGGAVDWSVYTGPACTPGSATPPAGQPVTSGTALTGPTGTATISYAYGADATPEVDTTQCLFAFYDRDGNGALSAGEPATTTSVTWSLAASSTSHLSLSPATSTGLAGQEASQVVTGTLTDQYGAPVAGAQVAWEVAPAGSGKPGSSGPATTDAEGQFVVEVSPTASASMQTVSATAGALSASADVYWVKEATDGSYTSATVLAAQATSSSSGYIDVASGGTWLRLSYDVNDILRVGQSVVKTERFTEGLKPGATISADPYRASPTGVSTFSEAGSGHSGGGGSGGGSGGGGLPNAPTGLSASAGNGQVVLEWAKPSSVGEGSLTGYNLFMGTAPSQELLVPVNGPLVQGTSYTVGGLVNGRTYYFVVQAVTTRGASANSNEATAMPAGPPQAPTGLATVVGDGRLTLSWDAPFSDGGRPVTGYNVYMSTSEGAAAANALNPGPVQADSYAVGGLTNGQAYFFVVRAVNELGLSGPSAEVSARPFASSGGPGGGLPGYGWDTRASTTVQLSSSGSPSAPGQRVTFTALVSPAPDGGSVDFVDAASGTSYVGCAGVPVVSGQATCKVGYESQGRHTVVATFSGTARFAPSTSARATHEVQGQTEIVVTASRAGGGAGVTYAVQVRSAGAAASGTVTLWAGGTLLCTAALDSAGAGHCTAPSRPSGGTVTARYSGDHVYAASEATLALVLAPTSYWLAGTNGEVTSFGQAPVAGPVPGGRAVTSGVVGMAATADGQGYWLVGRDGGVFAFGDAKFYGSATGKALKGAVVGMAATADGQGYWLVGRDGGVFAFGDAKFYGSATGTSSGTPIVGMAPSW